MLIDYVEEYSGKTFEEHSLNYLDVLVFSSLAYFDFPTQCIGKDVCGALSHASHFSAPKPNRSHARLMKLDASQDERLRALVSRSRRYGEVRVFGFSSDFVDASHQFGALSLMLGDILIVAYRGTDESITGWNEALRVSLDVPGKGQLLAQAHLERQASMTSGPIIVCGHSKGGNLASFAASACAMDPDISARIALVASFDGPGLSREMRKMPGYASVSSRIRSFIPKSSFIGNVNEHPESSIRYVDSSGFFIAQHFVYNWKTTREDFVYCRQTPLGKLSSGFMTALVNGLDDMQKIRLFDAIFFMPRLMNANWHASRATGP